MKNATIIIPCYNESDVITKFYDTLIITLNNLNGYYSFTLLFVNDGSSDNTYEKLLGLSSLDNNIEIINLSRNFGKEIALAAGFDYTNKNEDVVIIIDADLQHPPQLISLFLDKINEGFDDVYAVRKNRSDESIIKRNFTKIYYNILQKLSSIPVYQNAGDFRALSNKAFNALSLIKEKERYTKGYYSLIGFKKFAIEFEVQEREFGVSKWNYIKLTQLAINGITSFSIIPLRIATFTGVTLSFLSIIYLIYVVSKTLLIGEKIDGYPTLISCILFLGGVQLLTIGIIGEYIGKIFNEVKNRPLYFVKDYIKKE